LAEIILRNIDLFDGEHFTGKRDLRVSGSAVYDVASPGLMGHGPAQCVKAQSVTSRLKAGLAFRQSGSNS